MAHLDMPTAAAESSTADKADERERRFRLIAETIPSITWSADPTGRVTYVNDRWIGFTGTETPAGERGLAAFLHPDDAPVVIARWKESLASGREHRIECRIRRHDGMYRWFEARAVPYRDAQGRITQWFGATTDIDERKRGQEIAAFMSHASAELSRLSDYRQTLARIADLAIPAFADWCGMFLVDDAGNLERLALANLDPERVRFVSGMRDRYPYRATDPIGPGKVVATGVSCWSPEMTDEMLAAFAHDGTHLEMLRRVGFRSWVCVPIRLQGRIGGAMSFVMTDSGRVFDESHLGVAEDLAHRVSIAIENHELVAALRRSDQAKDALLQQLRVADRRKDAFIAMIAQELRNPLQPILNSVEVLRAKGRNQPELHWVRDVIDRQSQQLSRLIDDLMDVARVGEGKIELRRDRVAISSAINAAVEACRPLIESSRQQLTVSTPVEPIRVEGDLARLSQVFVNLINNAVKYTDPGGRISVIVDRAGAQVLVRVCDNGMGISADMLDRIFDPFTQVERSLERAQGGLGVGLTLARRLAELHGGGIEAKSAGVGHGSEFVVRLPAAAGAGLQ